MRSSILNYQSWPVGTKLASLTITLVGGLFAAALVLIGLSTSSLLERKSTADISDETANLVHMIDMFDRSIRSQVERFDQILSSAFPQTFSLDTSRTMQVGHHTTAVLRHGASDLNMNEAIPDSFPSQTGVLASLFVKNGTDFVRMSTSDKLDGGEHGAGTILNREHPGYAQLHANKTYIGLSTELGQHYISKYTPINDANGELIGAMSVAIDVSSDMKVLQDRIKNRKVAETGYFYILNSREGKNYGTVITGAKDEGKNLLDRKDANGKEFIKEILALKQGVTSYFWNNPESSESEGAEKIVGFSAFPKWNWVIVGEAYVDEATRDFDEIQNRFMLFGAIFLCIIGALLAGIIRHVVTLPLKRTKDAAHQLASGDLTTRLVVHQQDEIGQLMHAVNGISEGLSGIVTNVRQGSEQINNTSIEITSGNQDLFSRTEQQAASLEKTAAAMEQLTATVKQNADSAQQANHLAISASLIAIDGGNVVNQVVDAMASINTSSHKVIDIIGVIDGLAFQSKLLALNAAVEAARAGNESRGFAAVAHEIRALAQRSADAAKEIKVLIEHSVAQVNVGSKLAKEAGETMTDVVAGAKRMTDIVREISAASQEQYQGIEHMHHAIMQMEQNTQQNAVLAEQASAAAQSLQDQASLLELTVSIVKLDAEPAMDFGAASNLRCITPEELEYMTAHDTSAKNAKESILSQPFHA